MPHTIKNCDPDNCKFNAKMIKKKYIRLCAIEKILCEIDNILIIMDGISASKPTRTITIGSQTFVIANTCSFCDSPPVGDEECLTCPIDLEPFLSGIENEIKNINNIRKKIAIIKCDVIKHQ